MGADVVLEPLPLGLGGVADEEAVVGLGDEKVQVSPHLCVSGQLHLSAVHEVADDDLAGQTLVTDGLDALAHLENIPTGKGRLKQVGVEDGNVLLVGLQLRLAGVGGKQLHLVDLVDGVFLTTR